MSKLIKPNKDNLKADISTIDFSIESLKSKVSVKPLKKGGSNFKTHVLIRESDNILSYKPSYSTAIFCWLFLSVGLSLIFFGARSYIQSNGAIQFPSLLLFGLGLIFALAGSLMFYSFYIPTVFDKSSGMYKKGYTKKGGLKGASNRNENLKFSDIIALQIIGEHIHGDKNSYNSFELNLVLKTGERKNVIDHGNLDSIIDDAHIISEFLDIPIWHAKSHND